MSLNAKIINATGRAWGARVSRDHAICVEQMPARYANLDPSLLTAQKLYREYFTLGSGTAVDMNVNGSASVPQRFTVESKPDRCLVIKRVKMVLESIYVEVAGGTDVRRFGAASTGNLTNGLKFDVIQEGIVTPIFLDPVRNIGDFFNYTDAYLNFINAVSNTIDILVLTFDFEVPIVLPAGSVDRIEMQVRDNLSLLNYFRAMAQGSQELRLTRED